MGCCHTEHTLFSFFKTFPLLTFNPADPHFAVALQLLRLCLKLSIPNVYVRGGKPEPCTSTGSSCTTARGGARSEPRPPPARPSQGQKGLGVKHFHRGCLLLAALSLPGLSARCFRALSTCGLRSRSCSHLLETAKINRQGSGGCHKHLR